VLAVLALLLLAPEARAEAPERVAIVTADPDSPTAKRIQAELVALGVEVTIVAPSDDQPVGRAPLEKLARAAGAFAAIRLVPLGAGVEVWVADRVTGKTVVREVLPASKARGGTEDTVAVGAVELLRASLLELSLSHTAPRGEVEPPEAVERIAPPPPREPDLGRRHLLSATLGPGAQWSLGGVPPSFLGQLAVGWFTRGWLGAEAFAGMSSRFKVQEDEVGSSKLALLVLGVGPTLSSPSASLGALVGAGVAAVELEAQGLPENARYDGSSDSLWMPASYLRAGVVWEVADHVRVRADLTLLGTYGPMRVRFAGDEVARWGQPAGLGFVGLELLVPRGR